MGRISNWNQLKHFHQISYEIYAFGGLPYFLKPDILNQKQVAQLRSRHIIVMGKYIIYYKLSPYYIPHSHLQFSSVHVIKRSDTTDMATMLSDMHRKDGTHCSTGR